MSDYNVSSLIKIMQEGLAETQENAGRMILDPVAQQVQVDVDGKMITNLVKRKRDVHTEKSLDQTQSRSQDGRPGCKVRSIHRRVVLRARWHQWGILQRYSFRGELCV